MCPSVLILKDLSFNLSKLFKIKLPGSPVTLILNDISNLLQKQNTSNEKLVAIIGGLLTPRLFMLGFWRTWTLCAWACRLLESMEPGGSSVESWCSLLVGYPLLPLCLFVWKQDYANISGRVTAGCITMKHDGSGRNMLNLEHLQISRQTQEFSLTRNVLNNSWILKKKKKTGIENWWVCEIWFSEIEFKGTVGPWRGYELFGFLYVSLPAPICIFPAANIHIKLFLKDVERSCTFNVQLPLITSLRLNYCCSTQPSHWTTSPPNANTGPWAPHNY